MTTEAEHGILLSNDLIAARVDPDQGADIVSLVHLPTGAEALWGRPAPARGRGSHGDDADAFYDEYRGGIQDLFPNAGPVTVLHGARLPFHGEARRVPWDRSAADELVLETRLARYPFRLRKHIRIDADRPVLRITTEATNEGAVALPVHWGIHPVFAAALTEPGELIGVFTSLVADSASFGAVRAHAAGQPLPVSSDGPTRIRLEDGTAGSADLDYASCQEGWYLVRNMRTGLTAIVTWPLELFGTLWIWQECREAAGFPWWGQHHIVGVEPHTSGPVQELASDVADGLSVSVGPGTTLRAEFAIELRVVAQAELPALLTALRTDTRQEGEVQT